MPSAHVIGCSVLHLDTGARSYIFTSPGMLNTYLVMCNITASPCVFRALFCSKNENSTPC